MSLPLDDLRTLCSAALTAVADAARASRAVQAALTGRALTKGDKSPVTVADFAAQAIVSLRLSDAAPGIPLMGEEDAALLRDPAHAAQRAAVCQTVRGVLRAVDDDAVLTAIDRGVHPGGPHGLHWTLDPIDGTKGFLRGDQYAVALALIEDGAVRLGVLGCPNLSHGSQTGVLFGAVRGDGAFAAALDGSLDASQRRPIRVDAATDPTEARFCESVEAAHSAHGWSAQVARRLGVTKPPYRIDSQCKYGAVARGDAAIYLRLPTRKDYVEKIWDHAAGSVVVEEAGGRVTDVDGEPLDFSHGRRLETNRGIIATNGHLHDAVLAAVATAAG